MGEHFIHLIDNKAYLAVRTKNNFQKNMTLEGDIFFFNRFFNRFIRVLH